MGVTSSFSEGGGEVLQVVSVKISVSQKKLIIDCGIKSGISSLLIVPSLIKIITMIIGIIKKKG